MDFGIIGFGLFGEKRLVPGFHHSAGHRIVAITKRNEAEAREKATKHGIPYHYTDPVDLVSNDAVDAVYVASPNAFHADHVRLAAEHGKHVICEKPLATSLDEALDMAAIVKSTGITFMVAQCYRWAGSVVKIKEILDSGRLGDLRFIHAHFGFDASGSDRTWVFSKDVAGGGPTFDIGIHMIDLVRFLVNKDHVVSCHGNTIPFDHAMHPVRDVEASGLMSLQFLSGLLGTVSCSFDHPYLTEILVKGTTGFLHARHFTIVDKDAMITLYSDKDLARPDEVIVINNGNFYASQVNTFAGTARDGTIPAGFPGIEDGLVNMALLDAWVDPARSGDVARRLSRT